MKSFQKRLLSIQKRANLTVADLARWYGRPHATVRCWTQGTSPSGPPLDRAEVERMTQWLVGQIQAKVLPLPWLGRKGRLKRMEELRKKAAR